jgi:chloride channel protein, CIC family
MNKMDFEKINRVNYIERGITWIHDKIDARQFLILSSILVGVTAGLASVVLKRFVHFIKETVLDDYLLKVDFKYVYLFMPFLGIGLTVFIVQYFFKGRLNRGTTNILFSVAKKGSFLPFSQMYSHIITSGITVGFGGSAGLESPIVSTGSAIGSNYAQRYKLSYKDRTLLLAAGAAGGIAGAFNAPIAGVLFALEVLLIDINIAAFIPLLIASASGTLISKIMLKENILLSFELRQPFNYHNVPHYIMLGFLAGAVSIYHVNLFNRIEDRFEKMKSIYAKWIVGGVVLAVVVALFPSLFGEGYDSIKNLAEMKPELLYKDSILTKFITHPTTFAVFVLAAMLLKALAVGVTLGSGGNGGNFAPSLFVGAYLGYVFAYVLQLIGFKDVPVGNLTLVAMAGILSGVFHAPLTGIFLIAEITGGYELIIPLMIVSSLSFAFVKYFHPESSEIRKLKQRGAIISEDRDTTILAKIEVKSLIEKTFTEVAPGDTLRDIVETVKHSKRNTFPVVDKKGKLSGVVFLDDIREEMFDQKLYDKTHAKELMQKQVAKILVNEDIFTIMKKFEASGQWNLPVIELDGSYIGFISKSNILAKYRNELTLNR